MRTKEQLESPEFNDDMSDLARLLTDKGIEFTIEPHHGSTKGILDLIGYYPAGKDHIHIGKISVIRGMASFGMYEAYGGKFSDPERFPTAEDLINEILK